jgi:hypothetical protein
MQAFLASSQVVSTSMYLYSWPLKSAFILSVVLSSDPQPERAVQRIREHEITIVLKIHFFMVDFSSPDRIINLQDYKRIRKKIIHPKSILFLIYVNQSDLKSLHRSVSIKYQITQEQEAENACGEE